MNYHQHPVGERVPTSKATRVFRGSDSPLTRYLDDLHARVAPVDDGAVADYIPQLARVDPKRFGIALATVDGDVYESGDTRVRFTIQSISKPFVYGLVLELCGEAAVRERIGVEPTGEPFNSTTLDPDGRPLNPLVNAGAIAATGMIVERRRGRAIESIVELLSGYAGRRLKIDRATARSESQTGHRNRAIAHLLSAAGVVRGEPMVVVEQYFEQCAISLDCRDAAVLAATLARGGLNPLTGERVAEVDTVRRVLLVMATCGMYDGAGEWMYTVGLPAKSGVSGTIIAVLPGQLGIAVHSPPLDPKGNSVRGVAVCRRLAAELELHIVQPGARQPGIRATFTLDQEHSKRARTDGERAALSSLGRRARVLQLQGSLVFSAIEAVSRTVITDAEHLRFAVLDLRRVTHITDVSLRFLVVLARQLDERQGVLVLSGIGVHIAAIRRLTREGGAGVVTFPELDRALEWCEDQLLTAAGKLEEPRPIGLREHELFTDIDDRDVRSLRRLFDRHRFAAGATVIVPGEPGDRVYLVTRGRLTAFAQRVDGELRILGTLLPGSAFGELAFLENRPHRGLVRADTSVQCYSLHRSRLEQLRDVDPTTQARLMTNLARMLARRAEAMREDLAGSEPR